ncbi:salicylate hydroxylase [Niveomyces insectorum RCEF 264]|uniref:Salicylate hydroxylase n=1 Tax=Niveomyces insectorum RCEF 264 TaxID=1081102 RepID=A0A167MN55_9HYPO|nr:salicylate hydroxylase [Niveomyces insectorum RCEF 264]
MPSRPRIAIVGGGPAGLTMAVLLHKRNVPFIVFELRQKPTDEELALPSGMLDLHEGSGLTAIRECGLYDAFLPLTGECSQETIIADRAGTLLYSGKSRGTRPEISRNNLAKLLAGAFPADNIKWGHKLVSATTTTKTTSAGAEASTETETEVELDFGLHGKQTFDFVVGADGAWSKVRQLVTDVTPQFTGMHCITVTMRHVTDKFPHLAALVGSGSFMAMGKKHVIVSQRGPMDSSRIYLWLTVPDEHFATTAGLAGKPAAHAKTTLLGDDNLLGTFGAPIKELVGIACDEETADHPGEGLDIRPFYELPHGHAWAHKRGATLVGDAAHLMLPNGEGVNTAMFDVLMLSRAIVEAYEKAAADSPTAFMRTLDPLVAASEAALVERAKQEGQDTDDMMKMMFGTDEAAYDLVSFMEKVSR